MALAEFELAEFESATAWFNVLPRKKNPPIALVIIQRVWGGGGGGGVLLGGPPGPYLGITR